MATQLRAMSVGEILDGSFAIYRRIFGTLIGIAALCQGIPVALSLYMETTGGAMFNLGLAFGVWLLGLVGGLFTAAATVWAIAETYLGRPVSVGPALGFAARRAWPLFIAALAKYILIFIASLFFVIPGVIVACGYAVVTQIIVLESLGRATDALGRSWWLTRGHRRRAFAIGLVIFVLLYIPMIGVTAVGSALSTSPTMFVFATALGQLIYLVLYPLIGCAFTLFYYDLRVRKEAFDLEHLSRQIGTPVPS